MGQSTYKPRHLRDTGKRRELNLERDKRQKMYRGNDDWRKFSSKFLEVNHTCYCCGEKATVVDHVTPHKGDRELFEKSGNHIPLCFVCHNTVTTKFDRNFVAGVSDISDKIKWLNDTRLKYETISSRKFPRVKVIHFT